MKKQWTNPEFKNLMVEETCTNCSIVETSTLVSGREIKAFYCTNHDVILLDQTELLKHLQIWEKHNFIPYKS